MKKEESILRKVIEQLNQHKYTDLTKFLEQIDWFSVPREQIVPREKVRAFIKSIENEETRLNVARFLQKYEDYYFKETDNGFVADFGADPIAEFHRELEFLIKQLTSNGEFSDDKFSKLQQQVQQLKEENEQYKKANKFLQDKIDRFENPQKYGKFVPAELQNLIFVDIMKYLQAKQLVMPIYLEKDYTKGISCYQWYGSCALFGYFVWKMNQEFDLNEARDQLNWQIFETAIYNYDKLINEARKAVSKFRKDDKILLPAKADIIEDAIRYGNGEMKNSEIRQKLN